MVIITFYIMPERFVLKGKGLSDAIVVSINKKEYGFAVHFLVDIQKFLKSISD